MFQIALTSWRPAAVYFFESIGAVPVSPPGTRMVYEGWGKYNGSYIFLRSLFPPRLLKSLDMEMAAVRMLEHLPSCADGTDRYAY